VAPRRLRHRDARGTGTPAAPGRLRQASASPGSRSAGTALKPSPPQGACSPGHGMKQRGKTWGPGEDGVPQQPGSAGLCRLLGGWGGGTGTATRANREEFTRYETWQNKGGGERLRLCTEVRPASAGELFK